MASVANHLILDYADSNSNSIKLSNTSMNDSYHKIHGEVPTHPVVWRIASCDNHSGGKDFVDIIYEKAVDEGIAKVMKFYVFIFKNIIFFYININ